MTDRDTFAAAALTGLLVNGAFNTDAVPLLAYSMADAMLRERLPTPTTHPTPGEGSVQGEGSVGERLVERVSITHMLLEDNEKLRSEIASLREAIRRLADQDATLSVQGGNVTVTMDATLTEEERQLFVRLEERFESLAHFFDTPSGVNWQAKEACDRDRKILKALTERLSRTSSTCPHVRGTVTQHCSLNATLTADEREAIVFMAHADERDRLARKTRLAFRATLCKLLERLK